MIEKIADVLARADGYIQGLQSLSPGARVQYRKLAKAAIDALSEVEPYHGKAQGGQ